jgi:nicotinamide-nucleotide amidase
MNAAILCIGTELTRGELADTNGHWLATRLTELGFEVSAIDVVDDDRGRIERALRRLGAEHEVLIVTGGLGPTSDDITTACVAAVLGVELERDSASLAAITERMQRFGRQMAPSNAKQADFPEGARVLANRWGTAPGFSVRLDRAFSFFLPGVPREMHGLFDEFVVPALSELVPEPSRQIIVRCFGLPESTVNDRLAGLETDFGVLLGYRAHFPEIEVKVLARAATPSQADQQARRAADEVKGRLGTEYVFGEGTARLPEVVGQLLETRGFTIATAESCTGGLLAKLLTDEGGASSFFLGGVVAYANAVKERQLGVDAALLERHGAVSREVAIAMAEGARAVFEAQLAVSITGIAGPSGGSAEKPVGSLHLAVAGPTGTRAEHFVYPGTRAQIRLLAAYAALSRVRKLLVDVGA